MIFVPQFLAIWASGRVHFWRCNVILDLRKWETNYFYNAIRTSWITLPHFILGEFISAIIAPPTTPNNFWGVNERNFQKNLHLLVLSLLGRITPPITPKYSQRINWRNKFHLGYTRKLLGN